MALKIYTKTGDKGFTSLLGGTKIPKNNLRIEGYGTIDELNCHIGLCRDVIHNNQVKATLLQVQHHLFIIGSQLANDLPDTSSFKLPELHEDDITLLETQIDSMEAQLPAMQNFILPGGHATVSQIHVSRCVCRRAERLVVGFFSHSEADCNNIIIKYLNRLSDYLFVLARFMGKELNVEEIKWIPRNS